MQIDEAVLAERARHIHINLPAAILTNLVGICTIVATFRDVVAPLHLAIWMGFFIALAICGLATYWRLRASDFTPDTARHLLREMLIAGFCVSILWAIGMFFFFPKGALVQQFAFLCAIVLLGVCTAICYASYYQAFLATFLPFALLAVAIIATQQTIFYSALSSVVIFIPALLLFALFFSRLLIKSLQLRFENIDLVAQLTAQKELAESATLAKSRFLAAASHDLRQPTHALGLFIATLQALAQRPEIKGADVAHIATRLQAALSGLGRLLNGLLDVSRLDAGAVEVRKQPVFLSDELTSLYHAFSGPAAAKGLALKVRVPASLWTDTDPVLLHQILSNLVANAVRYTEHGRILIGCRRRAEDVEIQVWDTGIGIAQDQVQNIFEEFYQVDNVVRDHEQGLGLGLAIVQRSVHLLGARLDVTSTLGRGSLFSVTLPRVAVAPAPQQTELLQALQQAPVHAAHRRRRTVLIIDDDRAVLDAVQLLLSNWGHAVIPVSTMAQAIEAAAGQSQTIDLILADYRLAANLTGADAIRAVIARLGRTVPAVIITGDTSPERIREASASGFRLLHKPLDPQTLHALLREHDEATGMTQPNRAQ